MPAPTPSPVPTPSPTPTPQQHQNSHGMRIVSSVLGGLIALALLLACIACLRRRHQQRRSRYTIIPFDSGLFRPPDEDLEGAPMLPSMEERNASSSTVSLPPLKHARLANASGLSDMTPTVHSTHHEAGRQTGDGEPQVGSGADGGVDGLRDEVTKLTREVTRVQTMLQRLRSYVVQSAPRPPTPRGRPNRGSTLFDLRTPPPQYSSSFGSSVR